MRAFNPLWGVAAVVVLTAALFLAIIPRGTDVEERESDMPWYYSLAELDADIPQYADVAISDSALPSVSPPVLRIGARENPDVYLQSLDIQVEVTGNIASTRYTMVFKNNTNRELEGELTFPLPDGRTVTHYALDIDGRMRNAVPVEKARATQVFEEIQQREVDPGILERVEGNNFRTRIYPFPRRGTRTISVGYEEELAFENGLLYYRLPMAYPNALERFAVTATVWNSRQKPLVPGSENELRFDRADENYIASFIRENYRLSRALIFALPAPANVPRVIMQPAQGSHYFLASVAPRMETRKKQWSGSLAIVWDVSLSGSQRNFEHEMKALDIIFADRKNAAVHLYFLNNRLRKIANAGTAGGEYRVVDGNWDGLRSMLNRAIFDGGTDFSQINLDSIAGDEILFFSDGISTLSDADFIKNRRVNRPVHSIVSSAKADYSAMKLIAGKTNGKFVNINALSYESLKDELLNETLQFLGVEHGPSLREVYPSIATPVRGDFSVAGISSVNEAELTLLFGFGRKVERRVKVKLDAEKASREGSVHRIWAQKKIEELDMEFSKNRTELTELGQRFGIVTRNTSLIVLELLSDYVRFGIEPPASEPDMRTRYQQLRRARENDTRDVQRDMLAGAVSAAQNLRRWWGTAFEIPGEPRYPMPDELEQAARPRGENALNTAKSAATPPRKRGSRFAATDDFFESLPNEARGDGFHTRFPGEGTGALFGGTPSKTFTRGGFTSAEADAILAGISPTGHTDAGNAASRQGAPGGAADSRRNDSVPAYMRNLTGNIAEDYLLYLRSRVDHLNSPKFYFDMADWFYRHNDREIALRVLTSIAELELENAALYRMLGYRLKEYGEHALQKFVFRKVREWRPMEPQSYRDYALALADNGEKQAALDSLYSLLTRSYSASIGNRSRGMEEVVLTEMNHLADKNPRLSTSRIDRRLRMNMPVDVRVVLNWNTNNTNVDLIVVDPVGSERLGYDWRWSPDNVTTIGGRMSVNNRSGYGPEQFILRNAPKGRYKVYAVYRGSREFAAPGPIAVMAEIYTKYGSRDEQRSVVNAQLTREGGPRPRGRQGISESSRVLIGEFEI
jgi:hypothetical protein